MRQTIDESGEVSMIEQNDEDLEAKMEEFLRQQAERESGELPETLPPQRFYGDCLQFCQS